MRMRVLREKLRVEIENEMRVFLESLNFEIEMRVSQKSATNAQSRSASTVLTVSQALGAYSTHDGVLDSL